ncbi:hypothetical protein BRCON_2378 [Candidatus Sumerlaea chitinivorans]|uniref:Uncharacterized protein n=1 Tax=Sumerlaea chitinivorans TaxID=2250252 RepID=A0A2Z4Y8K1_SUMC1|nr:hypothetical protein BRCON_2378 [Candidatus Sumerlaea chitinivorans]
MIHHRLEISFRTLYILMILHEENSLFWLTSPSAVKRK